MKLFKKCLFLISLAVFLSSPNFGFLIAQEVSLIPDDTTETPNDEAMSVTAPTPLLEIKRLEADEPLYSIELRNVWVADLFRVIAHDYDLNIIIDQDISNQQNMATQLNDPSLITTVTASFTNISLEEALESIAESTDIILYKKDGIIRISSNLASEVFPLRYIDASLVMPLAEGESLPDGAPMIVSNIFELLSDRGRVLFGSEQNSIMVTDFPSNLENIRDYLKVVDVMPRQVLIEARFAEVRLQGDHALGVNWSLLGDQVATIGEFEFGSLSTLTDTLTSGVRDAAATETLAGTLQQSIPYRNTNWDPPISGSATDDPFSLTILNQDIRAVIQTLASNLDTNVLSAPRIATVNNRAASIQIIQSIPWAEPEVSVEEGVVSISWSVNFEEIGISLDVLPIISDDNNIILELNPKVSEQTGEFSLTITQSGEELDYIIPIIDQRETNTKVVIGNKQTLIIGGLIKNQIINMETKVPFLGDLPFLGNLFKSTHDTKDKMELLIFVSPTIIDNDSFANGKKMLERNVAAYSDGPIEKKIDLPEDSMLYRKYNSLEAMHEILKAEREELSRSIIQEKSDLKRIESRIKRRD